MTKSTFVILCLLISGTALPVSGRKSMQRKDAFPAFWKEFKTAVITRNKKTVAGLTRFPLGVSEGVANIKNSAELSRRFSEVFDQQTNAAQCFSTKQPTPDTESADRFTVVCPNEADNFVVYEFELTKLGWRFIHRQFPTRCRCR